MGVSSKKSTNKTTQNQQTTDTATSHNEVPDWIKNPTMQAAGNIQGILNQGAGAFAPTTSGLQKQAFDAAGGLKNSGYFDQAGDVLGAGGDIGYEGYDPTNAEAASLLDGGLDRYYNPFKEQVLNPVLTDFDEQSGVTRAGQAADAARNRSFQGSRYGIQEAQTEGQLARGRAATEGGLLDRMYTSATGLADSDAGRRQSVSLANAAAANSAASQTAQGRFAASQANQQAAMERARQLAALGMSEGSESRANLGVQAGLGGVLTDQENAARQYPLTFAGQTNGLLSGLNPELYADKTINSSGTMSGTSTSKTKDSDFLGGLGKAAQIAAMFSDRRVKRDVETLGFDQKGRRWVSFAYIWAPLVRLVGVIAQEVMRTDPQAVHVAPSGYMVVNYGALD